MWFGLLLTRMALCKVASHWFWKGDRPGVCSYISSVETAECSQRHTYTYKTCGQWLRMEDSTQRDLWWFAMWQTLPQNTNIKSGVKHNQCHAFYIPFYVQLLKRGVKIMAASPEGVWWILVNTGELCLQEKTNKAFDKKEIKTWIHMSS